MAKIIIAIDGLSSCGKSTTARGVAEQLNYTYIDTGAMYRAATLYFMENHISLTNPKQVEAALKDIDISFRPGVEGKSETYLNGINVENKIRSLEVADHVSEVAANKAVRKEMVSQQQKMGKKKGVVMDGRDIGTVVFPDAELKVFMTAESMIRAQRRQKELMEKGELVDLDTILENLEKRDLLDSTREEGPLMEAIGSNILDTSFMTIDEQIEQVVIWADSKVAHV